MIFPFIHTPGRVQPDDLELFAPDFSEIVLSLFPFASGPVSFHAFRPESADNLQRHARPQSSDRYLAQVQKTRQPVIASHESLLYLPVRDGTKILGAAVLAGMDGDLLKKVSIGWLEDRCQIISREFAMIKQQAHDPVTGLLNIRHLRGELDLLLKEATSFTLVLMEVWPRGTNTAKALRQANEASSCLGSLLDHLPLHHLGWGVFAYVWPDTSELQAQKFAKTLLDRMKRERLGRIHLGMTSMVFDPARPAAVAPATEPSADMILAQAWQALQTASLRGPHALCSFSAISNLEKHPLRNPPGPIMRPLQAAWRRLDGFAVILLRPCEPPPTGENFSEIVAPLLATKARTFIINGQDIYALLISPDRDAALAWTRALQEDIKAASGRSSFAGIAVFPDHGFNKADLPANARKALLHTRFFGPDTATVFDAVSLNISGDIYYNEGDLKYAVREYRLGLSIDPDNINLLNSLGEAHGRMNRHLLAVQFFEKVLRLDAANYMALFNLGVTYLMMKDEARAVKYLEKALALNEKHHPAVPGDGGDKGRANHELFFQLGRLYCQTGRYGEAIDLLSRCVAGSDGIAAAESFRGQSARRGSSYRYLGVAYKESGNNREAIAVLQRAIRFNPRDAASLSLLGELYSLEKQGDDIALSLCNQALDLDDTRWEHWYRPALIEFRQGQFEPARTLLKQGLRRNRRSIATIRLLALTYQELGLTEEAVKMARRLLQLAPADVSAKAMLAKLQKNKRRFSKERTKTGKESIDV